MFVILPNALYTRADLAAMLEGSGVDVDHFIGRLKARKVFKMLVLGEDLLEAIRKAPALAEREEVAIPAAANRGNRKRRGSARAAQPNRPGAKLDAYLQSLKEGRS